MKFNSILKSNENFLYFGLILYLLLFGSHILYPSLWLLLLLSLFFIKSEALKSPLVFLLIIALSFLYGVYLHNNPIVIDNKSQLLEVAVELLTILALYLIGSSIQYYSSKSLPNERIVLYILYGFFIAYAIGIAYSYFTIAHNQGFGYKAKGFWVYYDVSRYAYLQSKGDIPVTTIAYFISFVVMLIPFVAFNFTKLRAKNFTILELALLFTLALFSFYVAAGTGRRLTLLLLGFIFGVYTLLLLWKLLKKSDFKTIAYIFVGIALILIVGYMLASKSYLFYRLSFDNGLEDSRMHFWIQGLKFMWQFPWGEADKVPIAGLFNKEATHAHNLWIDIGKSYGIVTFVTISLFYLLHLKYLLEILTNKNIDFVIKNVIVIISLMLFANLMIEPVFQKGRMLFFYSIFFLGFVKSYALIYSKPLPK